MTNFAGKKSAWFSEEYTFICGFHRFRAENWGERATIMIGANGVGVVNEVGHAHYMRERIKNHEVNSDTYSIIITASSLVLGYAT